MAEAARDCFAWLLWTETWEMNTININSHKVCTVSIRLRCSSKSKEGSGWWARFSVCDRWPCSQYKAVWGTVLTEWSIAVCALTAAPKGVTPKAGDPGMSRAAAAAPFWGAQSASLLMPARWCKGALHHTLSHLLVTWALHISKADVRSHWLSPVLFGYRDSIFELLPEKSVSVLPTVRDTGGCILSYHQLPVKWICNNEAWYSRF